MSKKAKLDPAIEQRVKAGVAHFEATMGHLPIQMKTMSERMPEMFAGYMDIRQWVMREAPEGALPRKYKHLIFTLLDCVYGNGPGAENHARAGFRRGLTVDELLEGMGQILIVGGVGVYGRTAYQVIDNVLESKEGRAARAAAGEKVGGKAAKKAAKAAGKPVAADKGKAKGGKGKAAAAAGNAPAAAPARAGKGG